MGPINDSTVIAANTRTLWTTSARTFVRLTVFKWLEQSQQED